MAGDGTGNLQIGDGPWTAVGIESKYQSPAGRVRLSAWINASDQLAFAGENGQVSLLAYPLAANATPMVINLTDAPLTALAPLLDHAMLAWGDARGRVGLLDLETGEIRAISLHESAVTALSISPAGDLIASGSQGATVMVVGTDLVLQEQLTGLGSMVTAVAFAPAGHRLAVAGLGSEILLYNTTDWSVERTIATGPGWITAIEFVRPRHAWQLATVDSGGVLHLYTDRGKEHAIPIDLGAWANDLLWMASAEMLVAAQQDGNLSILVAGSPGNLSLSGRISTSEALYAVSALAGGSAFVTAGATGNLTLWGRDTDGDAVVDRRDPFPTDENQWYDGDGDGFGDNPQGHNADLFPGDPAASSDTDGDGYPDAWNEGFGAGDSSLGMRRDAFPHDPQEWLDSDGDGIGDNRDPYPYNRFITSTGQVRSAQFTAGAAVGLMVLYGVVMLEGRYRLRRFQDRLTTNSRPNLESLVATTSTTLTVARQLFRRGRCFAARRVLAQAEYDFAAERQRYRQAEREIAKARKRLDLCHAEGLEPVTLLRDRTRKAMAGGNFSRARELARKAGRAFNTQLLRAQRTAAGFGGAFPRAGAIPAAADTGIPGYDWHGRAAPTTQRDAPRVINISFSDCIINRSELKLADADASESAGGDAEAMNRRTRTISAGGRAHEA